jgi:hypothetical protein
LPLLYYSGEDFIRFEQYVFYEESQHLEEEGFVYGILRRP